LRKTTKYIAPSSTWEDLGFDNPKVLSRQSFDLLAEFRNPADQAPSRRWRTPIDARRRHSHDFDADITATDVRPPPAPRRLLRRQPSESAAVPCRTSLVGVRPSNTWTEQRHHRFHDPTKRDNANDNDDDDDDADDNDDDDDFDSESDGEVWC